MATTTTLNKNITETIHINILLDGLSYTSIGLVILQQTSIETVTLFHIRQCMKSQFDEDQLQTLGPTFKFLMISTETLSNPTAISTKQEKHISMSQITISEHQTHTVIHTHTNDTETKTNSDYPNQRNYKNKRHYSLDIEHCDSHSHRKNIGHSLPTHLKVPSKLKTTPKTLHTYTNKSTYANSEIQYCTIVVRPHNNANIQYSPLTFSPLPLPLLNPHLSNANKSMSIFERPNITKLNELKTHSFSSESSEPTLDTINTIDVSPNIRVTQLERHFGGTLPRIRLTNSTKNLPKPDRIQMTNILSHALVPNNMDFYRSQSQLKTAAYPILPTPSQLQSHISVSKKHKINETSMSTLNTHENGPLYTPLINDEKEQIINLCRFTVIGSAQFEKYNGKREQQAWMFYDPSELILGLQGVHHSEKEPIWMDLVCDHQTFIMISEHVRPQIHQLTIEDCVTEECREKLELFDNYLFICIHTSHTERLYIIVFKSIIITYHARVNSILGSSDRVIELTRDRLEKRHKHKSYYVSPGWITHTILDVIVDRMIPDIHCRVSEVQIVEQLVFILEKQSHNELLHRMNNAKDALVVCQSRLWPMRTVTENLTQTEWRVFLSGVPLQYWNDVHDHVRRMVDEMEMAQSSLESCQSIFVAKISLEMANQSNAFGDSAGRLAAVGSIFMPLAYIAGLWGMNCKVPFQWDGPGSEDLWGDTHYGFAIVCCLMLFMAVVTYKFSMAVL